MGNTQTRRPRNTIDRKPECHATGSIISPEQAHARDARLLCLLYSSNTGRRQPRQKAGLTTYFITGDGKFGDIIWDPLTARSNFSLSLFPFYALEQLQKKTSPFFWSQIKTYRAARLCGSPRGCVRDDQARSVECTDR